MNLHKPNHIPPSHYTHTNHLVRTHLHPDTMRPHKPLFIQPPFTAWIFKLDLYTLVSTCILNLKSFSPHSHTIPHG